MKRQLAEKGQIFGLFMAVFQYPDQEFIQLVQNGSLNSAIRSYSEDTCDKKLDQGLLKKLNSILKEYSAIEGQELFSLLKNDYLNLFIGAPKLLAPPYASIYWDDKQLLMREPAVLLKRLYRDWGFEISEDYKDLPDHISLQLEFLYQLGQSMEADTEAGLYKLQKKVVDKIMLKWIYEFLDKIKENEKLKFYSIITEILINILEEY